MSEKNHIKVDKILLAIDKSGYKDKATTYALTLAKSLGAEITVIHVIDKTSMGATGDVLGFYRGGKLKAYQEALKKDADSLLNKVVQLGKKEAVTVHEEVLVASSVKKAILDYAKNKKMDLIVIGTRGMTGLEKFLMGSVATDVIAHAHCPVLAVR
jgi:nucleotide-binding universal stress UspA family protein